MSLVSETILVDRAAVIGTKLELYPVCLECWKPTEQVSCLKKLLKTILRLTVTKTEESCV
jgi:hypothetical protein